jgi:hypothetical protein
MDKITKKRDLLSVGFAREYDRVKLTNPFSELERLNKKHGLLSRKERQAWEEYMAFSLHMDEKMADFKKQCAVLEQLAVTFHDRIALYSILDK